MAKFIKKPVVIDAYTFDELFWMYSNADTKTTDSFKLGERTITFVPGGDFTEPQRYASDTHFIIDTLEGEMKMSQSDMLIIGVRGECYPCKIDIFHETYDNVKIK